MPFIDTFVTCKNSSRTKGCVVTLSVCFPQDLQVFSMRLEEVGRRLPVPRPVYDTLWDQCIRVANRAFVEG